MLSWITLVPPTLLWRNKSQSVQQMSLLSPITTKKSCDHNLLICNETKYSKLDVFILQVTDQRPEETPGSTGSPVCLQVLMCSCFFPVYCGFTAPVYRGQVRTPGSSRQSQRADGARDMSAAVGGELGGGAVYVLNWICFVSAASKHKFTKKKKKELKTIQRTTQI